MAFNLSNFMRSQARWLAFFKLAKEALIRMKEVKAPSRALSTLTLTALLFHFDNSVLASDFGTTGLITIPSARQLQGGEFAATISSNQVANIFNATYQITPWLESSFRYTVFNPYNRQESQDIFRDRSYEVKVRLATENRWRPAIAVGVRDIAGTGLWNGEYVVATKKFNAFEVSAGLGWGRFSSRRPLRNPLGWIDNRFDNRPVANVGGEFVGELRGESFFRGPVGVFAGVRYQIPKIPLAILLEYSGDDYSRESGFGSLDSNQPVNFGIEWSLGDSFTVGASYQQGDFAGISFRTVTDFTKSIPKRSGRFQSVLTSKGAEEAPEFLNLDDWYDRMLFDVERMGLRLHSVHGRPGDTERTFIVSNETFAETGDAINQFFRATELHVPKEIRQINVQLIEDGFHAPAVRYLRAGPAQQRANLSDEQLADVLVQVTRGSSPGRPLHETDFGLPRLALGADLAMRIQLMDPDEPLKRQLYLKGTARLAISETLNLWSTYSFDISNDFNTKRPSDSVLPHVRSEINQYLTQGETGIDSFFLEDRRSIANEIHVRSFIGIAEEMFGGIGSEVLYEPFGQRWALGANLNWVRQRAFTKNFRFQDYEVVTGHLSAFWASPFYNLDFGFHVGRYLAGDRGFTLEGRQTFDNGFSVGAFFTKTNVSAEEFGEGSFDKGLFISVPLHLMFPVNTRSRYSTVVRSLERDGGRRLEGGVGNLWWSRRAVRFDALSNQVGKMIP